RKPTRVSELLLPECSMINEVAIHPEHLMTTRKIGDKIVSGRTFAPGEAQPVYLSRSGLKGGGTNMLIGEEKLEKGLDTQGVRIVRPETMMLAEQIELFSTHNTFIGLPGSAFQTLLLRQTHLPSAPVRCIYLGANRPSRRLPELRHVRDN